MANGDAELITGIILAQSLLIEFLERRGVIGRGEFAAFLADYLDRMSVKHRDDAPHQVLRQLRERLVAFGEPAPRQH